MGFKNRLFFSSKKSGSSSPDSSNSPQSVGSNSPNGSDKKKPKSNSKEENLSPNPSPASGFGGIECKKTQLEDGFKKKDGSSKSKKASSEVHARSQDHSSSPGKSNLSSSASETKKETTGTQPPSDMKEGPASVSPILASSLGLNRIKTRSGPLPRESFFSFENDEAIHLSKLGWDSGSSSAASGSGSGNTKKEAGSSKREVEANGDHISPDIGPIRNKSSALPASGTGQFKVSPSHSGPVGSSEFCTPENSYELENPKESESPRYQALLRMTSAPRKRFPCDVKSFSHELNSKGVRPYPLWKPRRSNNLEEILDLIRTKFDKAKEEVNSDLAAFGLNLMGILEKNAGRDRAWTSKG